MSKIQIKQDILSPEYIKTVKLNGYHPSELLKLVPSTLQEVLRIDAAGLFEDLVKWDVSEDPVSFAGEWRAKDGKDKRTNVWATVIIEGEQSKKDLSGKVTIVLRCQIETTLEYNNLFERGVLLLFDNLFYKNHRMAYIEDARKQMIVIEDALKRHFGAMEREKSHEIS